MPASANPKAPPARVGRHLDVGDWLSVGVLLIAVRQCLVGVGDPFSWVLLALLVPAVRCLSSAAYRERLLAFFGRLWDGVESSARQRGRVPWLAAFVLAGLPPVVLYLFDDRMMGAMDSVAVGPAAISIVRQGDWELSEFVPRAERDKLPYFLTRTPQGIYSAYPAGMVPFALPMALAAELNGADFKEGIVINRLEKWTAVWVASGCLTLFFLLALRLAPPGPALAMTVLLATGSVVFSVIGQALWQHGGIVLWMLLILTVEFHLTQPKRVGLGAVAQGIAAGLMVATRLSAVVFLVPFGLWILWRAPRRALVVVPAALLAFAPWAWLYHGIYGSVWGPSSVQFGADHWGAALMESSAGLLLSPARGLLVYQPWLLLGLVVLIPAVRRLVPRTADEPGGWMWLFAVVIVLHFGIVAMWRNWWGGHCWGSRLLTEAVPLLALLCLRPLAVLWEMPRGRQAVVALGVLSFVIHASGVHFAADSWNGDADPDKNPSALWDWAGAPFFHAVFR